MPERIRPPVRRLRASRHVHAALQQRPEMFVRDLRGSGALLAAQRRADLAAAEPGFLAKLRQERQSRKPGGQILRPADFGFRV